MSYFEESNVENVLKKDGVDKIVIGDYENLPTINIDELKEKMGSGSWAVRTVYNSRFGGVLICQKPGEGNRLHFHKEADECWVIIDGEWEWYIEGLGTKNVRKNDVVVVKKGIKHKIKCVGTKPGIRFAITMPDVDHNYAEEDDKPT
jgi:mannose-6-phosphate isomerase-like protein (cupin superfamily)